MFVRPLVGLLFIACPALAEIVEKDIATCAAIEGSLERLTCFDKLAESNGLNGPQPVETGASEVGKWYVERTKNPIDDTEKVVLALTADEGVSAFGQPIILFLRCQSRQFEFYISWNDYLASDGEFGSEWKYVLVRHGSDEAVPEQWSTSTDQKATFAADPRAHLKQMLANTSFVAQITPYNASPITAVFDTTGLKESWQPLMAVCGLKL
jgi:type VI secretion system protein VasI